MNLKLQIKDALLVLVSIIAFSSCENHVEEAFDPDGIELCTPDISFAKNIKPVIDNKCIGCHNGIDQFPDLSAYEGIRGNSERVKLQVVSRTMPIGGSLTTEEVNLIQCWVDNGAPNN